MDGHLTCAGVHFLALEKPHAPVPTINEPIIGFVFGAAK